jgi:hypothetical protein
MKKHLSSLNLIRTVIQTTGVSDNAAALLAGVPIPTLTQWKSEDPEIAFFLEAARAELQRELIAIVREARRRDGSSDWRGAAWLLERLFPETFGRRSKGKSERPQDEAATDPAPVRPNAPASSTHSSNRVAAASVPQTATSKPQQPKSSDFVLAAPVDPGPTHTPPTSASSLFSPSPKPSRPAPLASSIIRSVKSNPPDFANAATAIGDRVMAAAR